MVSSPKACDELDVHASERPGGPPGDSHAAPCDSYAGRPISSAPSASRAALNVADGRITAATRTRSGW